MKQLLVFAYLFALLGVVAFFVATPTARAEPELTESSVENGDVFETAPESLRLCFSEPIVNRDVTPDMPDPWGFNVSTPDGRALGLRIVFEPGGDCVDVFPGIPEDPSDGIWTFDWFVRSQVDDEEASGVIAFRVGPGAPPVDIGEDDGDSGDLLLVAVIAAGVGAFAVVAVVVVTRLRGRRVG